MLRALFGAILLGVLLAAPLTAAGVTDASATALPAQPVLRIIRGDDPRWATPDWDDRDWPVADPANLPAPAGVYWVRFRVALPAVPTQVFPTIKDSWTPHQEGRPVNAVAVAMAGSSELYWDGKLLWVNGVVGPDRNSEKVGAIDVVRQIPEDQLGPGEHSVALRISTHHYNFPGAPRLALFLYLHNYETDGVYRHSLAMFPLIAIGCAVVVTLLSGVLYWLLDRRRPLLLCGLFSLAVAVYYTLASWRTLSQLLFHPEPYDLIHPLAQAVTVLMAVIGCLMLAMFLDQFAAPRKWAWFAALGACLTGIGWELWDSGPINGISATYWIPLWECRAALAVTAAAAGWAVWRKRPGAWLVLSATVVGLGSVHMAVPQRQVLNGWFLLTFALLVVALFAAVGLQVQASRRAARATEITAARMELELLKRSFQPHFLMNTLAVLTEVVEQDPKAASRLIDDLAAEFRTVARASAEHQITIAREIELCRTHLRVMSVRTGRAWSLETHDLNETALVPPAVFLTLIENGFAHQRVVTPSAAFVVRAQPSAHGTTRYTFFSPGEIQVDPTRPEGGTGMRYVKARLEESFPGRWSLHGEPVEGGWQTTLELPA